MWIGSHGPQQGRAGGGAGRLGRARQPDDLSSVGATGLPQELRPLASALDDLRQRIGALRRAERDFVDNAADELRTPLAAVHDRLELSADPDAQAAIAMVDGLTQRVERLLQLAALRPGQPRARSLRPAAPATGQDPPRQPIRQEGGDLGRRIVAADADAVAILLRNLLKNAAGHGTGGVRAAPSPDGRLWIAPAGIAALPQGLLPIARAQAGGTHPDPFTQRHCLCPSRGHKRAAPEPDGAGLRPPFAHRAGASGGPLNQTVQVYAPPFAHRAGASGRNTS